MQPAKEIVVALEGSKVVIVGGSSGIGLEAAEAIVERGADVILVGRPVAKRSGALRKLGRQSMRAYKQVAPVHWNHISLTDDYLQSSWQPSPPDHNIFALHTVLDPNRMGGIGFAPFSGKYSISPPPCSCMSGNINPTVSCQAFKPHA
jgi:hypothetical protein